MTGQDARKVEWALDVESCLEMPANRQNQFRAATVREPADSLTVAAPIGAHAQVVAALL